MTFVYNVLSVFAVSIVIHVVLGLIFRKRPSKRRVPEITWDDRHSDDCPALVRFYPGEQVECLCGVDAALREAVAILKGEKS